MKFSASYDRLTRIVSAVVCLGMLAVAVLLHNLVISVLGVTVILVAFAYSPLGYVIEGRSILVRRLAGSVRVNIEDVREVRLAMPEDWLGCMRLWGSGGLFGYYGLFRSDALGKFTAHMSSRKNNVIVITAARTALFSPDDAEGFLAAVRAAAPITMSGPVPAIDASGKAPRRLGSLPAVIGAAVGLAAIGLVIAAFTYAPGPPAYTLTSTGLTIHDRFYPVTLRADQVDVNHIRIIDVSADRSWRPILRTNGFANSHYESGWFRVANGQKVRLYRAGGNELVLIPPKDGGAAVLFQAPNPAMFIDQVRAAWR